MYRVNQNSQRAGDPIPLLTNIPTWNPTRLPSVSPSSFAQADDNFTLSPMSDAGVDVVRYGLVQDRMDGTYQAMICPVVSGTYEVHVLLGGQGVSNQPFQILDKWHSQQTPMGLGSHIGQYVGNSPYALSVRHSLASGITTTAEGPGLVSATVGVPVSFTVTVRDPWNNVLRLSSPTVFVAAHLDRTPGAKVTIHNFNNGSYNVEYIPLLKGPNLVSVRVDGFHIRDSPFTVPVLDGSTSAIHSYATGPGLLSGVAGSPSYFLVYAYDLDNNRKESRSDVYTFTVTGANLVSSTQMLPCPSPPQSDHAICDALDAEAGLYFGVFTPTAAGTNTVRVFLETDIAVIAGYLNSRALAVSPAVELQTSGFTQTVRPSGPVATYSDVTGQFAFLLNSLRSPLSPPSGTLYDNVAGVTATVHVQTRDAFRNLVTVGGQSLELALLGVAGQWGTEEPFTPLQGRANEYYYKGAFFSNSFLCLFLIRVFSRLLRWIPPSVRQRVRPRGRLLCGIVLRPLERPVRDASVAGPGRSQRHLFQRHHFRSPERCGPQRLVLRALQAGHRTKSGHYCIMDRGRRRCARGQGRRRAGQLRRPLSEQD
jgi:hypothetical protein